ncbi:MAG TPA: hypothetical protein VK530_14110 [Candidatus Acidoferrum sp.]|nr:hypothetical protein [Candidatus Acidoferrum sp.]
MQVMLDDITDTWEWSECTVAAYKAKLDATNDVVETQAEEEADASNARGELAYNTGLLMDKASSYLSLSKRKYRNDAAKLVLLRNLRVHNMSLPKKLKLALDVEHAWKQIDQTYVPMAGNTFAAYQTLRALCQTKYENVSKEDAEEGEAGGEMYKSLKELHRCSVDWYQEAMRRFGIETPHGILIRNTIDTAPYVLSSASAVPTLSAGWNPVTSKVVMTFSVDGATSFEVERSDDGGATWTSQGTKTSPAEYAGVTSGTYLYRVRGLTESGTTEWSAPHLVVVP